jgi:hypothetical protein
MRSLLFLNLFLIASTLFAQQGSYLFSAEIDSIVFYDTNLYKYQKASEYFSYIAEYRKAIEIRDQQYPNATGSVPTEEQKILLSAYHPVNAKEYIIQQAAKTRIVIINEAHHQPRHRVFMESLLEPLKKLGYSHIGFETLDYHDSALSERKFPLLSTGYYVKEPCMGNLIRASFRNGYAVFPYEKKYDDRAQKDMNRELAEALNIQAYLNLHPDEKVIIYCGYDHLIKDSTNNFMVLPMAGQLRRLTGIDPFTVDQVDLSEFHFIGNTYRKAIDLDSDAILLDSIGNPFNRSFSPHKKVDCMVYHPNTSNYNYRPKWRVTQETLLMNITPEIKIDFPCMVKVFNETEMDKNAVPTDIIELQDPGDNKTIVVSKSGSSRILITNRKGQSQELIK